MRNLIVLVLFAVALRPLSADLKSSGRTINTIDMYADAGLTGFGGDTYQFTAWTGPTTGGNWNGGHVYGSYNDGHGCPGTGGNIAFLEISRIDWVTKTNTSLTCVNGMNSYGASSHQPSGWTTDGVAWKSFNPFSYNGHLYWFVNRQEISSPWRADMSSLITSPDGGRHWCNQATYAATGTCDSSNYRDDGDAPPNPSTGMMWGSLGDYGNPMARPMVVQFCQDQTCTGMPFNADNYLYFVSNTGLVDKLYASCVTKSRAAIMDKTQYWYWTGGNSTCGNSNSWTHTIANAVPIVDGNIDLVGYPSSIVYIPQAGQFLMTSYGFDYRTIFLTSNTPWGPWRRIFIAPTGNQGGFSSTNLAWLDSSCSGCNTNPGRWRLTYTGSVYGHVPDASLYLYQIDIQNGGRATPDTDPAGITNLGRIPIRASNSGTGNRLILNGLARAYVFDDFLDNPVDSWSSASTYTRDVMNSGTCLVSGANPPGYLVWGVQTGTAPITVSSAGTYLGSGYSAQFFSNAAGCSGPLPISGNAAFTVQMVMKPDVVTGSTRAIFHLTDPSLTSPGWFHKDFYAIINVLGQGGTHIDIADYSPNGYFLTSSPPLVAGQYQLITVVKYPGVLSPSTVKLYIGSTPVPMSVGGGFSDQQPADFSSSLALRLGCFGWDDSWCNPGTFQGVQLPAVHSFFGIYNRALSADEVTHNYAALKAAMAQPTRGITLN